MSDSQNTSIYKFSVLIPFYKADEFFDECIDSILKQTHKASEIVVVNDGSGEASKRYLSKFEDIATIIHLDESNGPAGARNVAIEQAACEWLAFQDADDIWELDKLEKQVKALQENPGWVACHTGVRTFNSLGEISKYMPYNIKPAENINKGLRRVFAR